MPRETVARLEMAIMRTIMSLSPMVCGPSRCQEIRRWRHRDQVYRLARIVQMILTGVPSLADPTEETDVADPPGLHHHVDRMIDQDRGTVDKMIVRCCPVTVTAAMLQTRAVLRVRETMVVLPLVLVETATVIETATVSVSVIVNVTMTVVRGAKGKTAHRCILTELEICSAPTLRLDRRGNRSTLHLSMEDSRAKTDLIHEPIRINKTPTMGD